MEQRTPDARGFRALFGVLGPATNTIVQPDFDDLRPQGVTNHYSRILVQDAQALSDESFMAGTHEISANTEQAVHGVMACRPDYLIMGMSAVTFYGGLSGGQRWKANIEDVSGIGISVGSEAVVAALNAYDAGKRVALLSPYYPSANAEVAQYLKDCGYQIVRDHCLRCPSWTAIARVQEQVLREQLLALNGNDVDLILQVGTNLSMLRLAAEAERWLEKPVIAINAATYWHALRANKIADPVVGFGRLLEDF